MKTAQVKNKTLYLIRHGHATFHPEGYGEKKMTAGLLPEGVVEMEQMGDYLRRVPASYNISSEIPRCRESAAIISRITGKQFVFDSRLNEFHQEAFGTFKERIADFLTDLAERPEKNILICTHSAVIAGIKELITTGNFRFKPEYDDPAEGVLAIIMHGEYREIQVQGTHS